jgi:tripartite-type tricarboxylate transporter receptor subunit TctC
MHDTMNRRRLLALAALATAPLSALAADAWPQHNIRAINPGAPGGTNDILTRDIAEPVGRLLGQTVYVESKPGAGGVVGAQFVAQQPADGYTILTHHNGLVTAPMVSGSANYDALRDFVPLSLQGTSPLILMAHPSMPATLAAFVAFARANPGKLEWGTSALGGVGHLAMELFHDEAGIQGMVKVPFSGSAPATQALLTGEIKYLLSSMTSATAGLVKEGKLRLLAVSTLQRSPLLPELPAISEVVPGFEAEAWFGLVARAGTPAPVVDKLSQAIVAAVSRPDIVEKYRALYVVARPGRAEFAQLLQKESQRWAKVVREKNIRLD